MTFKKNSLFQTRKNRQKAQTIKRDELMDHIFDSCIAIQTYIHSMDSQLDLYLAKARQAQNCQNKRELSFAFSNILCEPLFLTEQHRNTHNLRKLLVTSYLLAL